MCLCIYLVPTCISYCTREALIGPLDWVLLWLNTYIGGGLWYTVCSQFVCVCQLLCNLCNTISLTLALERKLTKIRNETKPLPTQDVSVHHFNNCTRTLHMHVGFVLYLKATFVCM